jgi:hypothetical protein
MVTPAFMENSMNKISIIGTAGRDKTKRMTHALWAWMLSDAMARVPKGSTVVSGGAAWADHLAVALFLAGHASELQLHLPAPMVDTMASSVRFAGEYGTSGGAANYYHERFSQAIGVNTLEQIGQAGHMDKCNGTWEPVSQGYGAMMTRNLKVAQAADWMLAYTFGEGDVPADGGTKHTWDAHTRLHPSGTRTHITLPNI